MKKRITATVILIVMVLAMAGCTEAERVSTNIATQADNFNVVRHVVVINNRTDTIVFECVGKMSITENSDRLDLIIEDEDGQYYKHILLLSEETFVSIEDVGGSNVNKFKYEVNFLPEMIIPFTVTSED